MFVKTKPIRKRGKALAELNEQIWLRDGGCCLLCGVPVPFGTKFHHIIFRSHGGSDVIENGATLCQTGNNCHGRAHGVQAKDIKEQLLNYVRGEYLQ